MTAARWLILVLLAGPAVAGVVPNNPAPLGSEVEPNDTPATATPLSGGARATWGNVVPEDDVDFFSFAATAGDRIYAAVETSTSAEFGDCSLDLISTDGTTVLETDQDDGSFNDESSSLAGTEIPADGTYYLRVSHLAFSELRPYRLHFAKRTGAPVAEVEPNGTVLQLDALPAGGGWRSGTVTSLADQDWFGLELDSGDTVSISLDLDPERDNVFWNGRLAFGPFGDENDTLLSANDSNPGSSADPNSEAFFFTVLAPGTYVVSVDSVVAAGLGVNATYQLSVAVHPYLPATEICNTYFSEDQPLIPEGPGTTTSSIVVPGHPRIADLDVGIDLDHERTRDLDITLVSPADNQNVIYSDLGSDTPGAQIEMTLVLDDEAAQLVTKPYSSAFFTAPFPSRLDWYDGEDAGGTWTLVIDDNAEENGGVLYGWAITVCEPPPPTNTCAPGFAPRTIYTTDFEFNDAGFTASGMGNEWEYGSPSLPPLDTCNSGTQCWKTDLDDFYDDDTDQDLVSPVISLAGVEPPIEARWVHRHQMESATYDHVLIEAREAADPDQNVRLYDWLGGTQQWSVGADFTPVEESSGWGELSGRIDQLADKQIELRFHLDSDFSVTYAGLAIDDVSVIGCLPASLDIDRDGQIAALTDGLLILRYLFGFTGATLITGAYDTVHCGNCDAPSIEQALADARPRLDLDDDGEVDALTDGLLFLRFLSGSTGSALINGAVDVDCARCDAPAIESYIQSLLL